MLGLEAELQLALAEVAYLKGDPDVGQALRWSRDWHWSSAAICNKPCANCGCASRICCQTGVERDAS